VSESDALSAKPGPEPLARRAHGSGDAWVAGPDGTRYWGTFGAAGLMVAHRGTGVLLQHRAEWSHFGGTWGLPGGARHEHESAADAAIREAEEEAGVPGRELRLRFASVLDLDWWSYTTVVADVPSVFAPVVGDAESLELRWVGVDQVAALPLHPGFAAAWPSLRADLGLRPRLVVDVANVVGSRPDGWWRDRAGATGRFIEELDAAVRRGLPAGLLDAPHDVWWPEVTAVLEGEARATTARPDGVRVVRAERDGDAAVVDEVTAGPARGPVTVVTSDRGLSERVRAKGARVVTPRALLSVLGSG
jgi:ADP-ribose pyrophosphatase